MANIKSLPIDVLMEIIVKLPGAAVMNLCMTDKDFANVCKKYEDRIYSTLLLRDNFPKYDNRTAKESYLKEFTMHGQIYILDVNKGGTCDYELSNIARIPRIGELKDLSNKVTFELPGLGGFERELTPNDYETGKTYWVAGRWGKINSLKASDSMSNAIILAVRQIDIDVIQVSGMQLRKIFPNNYQELTPFSYDMLFQIRALIRKYGCIVYVDTKGNKTALGIKKVRLM